MAVPSFQKPVNSLHIFSMKPPSSSSSLTFMKRKTLLQTFIFSHMYRIARALTKAKSVLLQLFKNIQVIHLIEFPILKKIKYKNNKQKKQLFFGSFRLHYNWCSSHVMPVMLEPYSYSNSNPNVYYDSSWKTYEIQDDQQQHSSELSGYLQWLEEKDIINNERVMDSSSNEIDKLADLFIANCHEKFRLEKQESYRRFQEMMARSIA